MNFELSSELLELQARTRRFIAEKSFPWNAMRGSHPKDQTKPCEKN